MLEGLLNSEVVQRDTEKKRAEVKMILSYPKEGMGAYLHAAVLKSNTEAL